MSPPSLPAVQLATVLIEVLLYGCFLTLYILAFVTIIYRRQNIPQSPTPSSSRRLHIGSPPILASFLMLITVTGHFITLIYRAFHAFILSPDGPTAFYNDLSQPTEQVLLSFSAVHLLIWDAVLIYRLWIVWNKVYWVLLLPSCTYLGSGVAGIAVIRRSELSDSHTIFTDPQNVIWLTSYAGFIFATNIVCTSCIAWRIWRHNQKTKKFFGTRSSATGALGIFVESAAVYAMWNIVYIFIFCFHSPMEFFALNIWVPISGISFLLILIRVGMGRGIGEDGPRMPSLNFPMGPLAVNISQVRNQDNDFERSPVKDEADLQHIGISIV